LEPFTIECTMRQANAIFNPNINLLLWLHCVR